MSDTESVHGNYRVSPEPSGGAILEYFGAVLLTSGLSGLYFVLLYVLACLVVPGSRSAVLAPRSILLTLRYVCDYGGAAKGWDGLAPKLRNEAQCTRCGVARGRTT